MTRVALITGGGTGIGAAVARSLADNNWIVYVMGRSPETLNDVADTNAQIRPLCGDINIDDDRRRVVEAVLTNHPQGLSLLINNAGISQFGALDALSPHSIDSTIDTNLRSPIALTQLLVDSLRTARGTVINVSSAVAQGIRASPDNAVYAACKAAMDVLTRSWSVELAPLVRVVGIAPGVTDTDIGPRSGMPTDAYRAFLDTMADRIPSGRVGQPTDVSALVLALTDPSLVYLNGLVIPVDGGLSVT